MVVVDRLATALGVEAGVEGDAVLLAVPGEDSAADPIASFEHDDIPPGVAQIVSGSEPGQARSHDHDPAWRTRIRPVRDVGDSGGVIGGGMGRRAAARRHRDPERHGGGTSQEQAP